jgi:hypothetical protein
MFFRLSLNKMNLKTYRKLRQSWQKNRKSRCQFHKHVTSVTYSRSKVRLRALHGSNHAMDDSTAYFAKPEAVFLAVCDPSTNEL